MSSEDADLTMYSVDAIEGFAYVLEKVMRECDEEDADIANFNVFDSIKTAIMAIPVRFVLQNVTVTTLEGSTTEIPYTVKTGGTNTSRYFGVDNVGKYLYNLVIAGMGEVDVPWYINILGVEDDPTGYENAVRYIQSVENEISAFSAQSATGKTKFKAWIEPAVSPQDVSLMRLSEEELFTISCNNETAVLEDGVLSFTGAGFIEVVPNTTQNGTLYIEMTEDGITKTATYELNVAASHDCYGDEWKVAVCADEDQAGYKVQTCAVCNDVIAVEEYTNPKAYTFELVDRTTTSANVSLSSGLDSETTMCFVLAAYDADGRMIALEMVEDNVSAEEPLTLSVSCGADEEIFNLKGFILEPESHKPAYPRWEKVLSVSKSLVTVKQEVQLTILFLSSLHTS